MMSISCREECEGAKVPDVVWNNEMDFRNVVLLFISHNTKNSSSEQAHEKQLRKPERTSMQGEY